MFITWQDENIIYVNSRWIFISIDTQYKLPHFLTIEGCTSVKKFGLIYSSNDYHSVIWDKNKDKILKTGINFSNNSISGGRYTDYGEEIMIYIGYKL